MGVRGLTTWAKVHMPGKSLVFRGSKIVHSKYSGTVLVDASNFVHFAVDKCGANTLYSANAPYTQVSEFVKQWVVRVIASGVRLVFVFDGSIKELTKSSTLDNRFLQREADLQAFSESLERGDLDATTVCGKAVWPPLMMLCVVQTLQLLACQNETMEDRIVLHRDWGEADGTMARLARFDPTVFAVVSADSDFYIVGPGACTPEDVLFHAGNCVEFRVRQPEEVAWKLAIPPARLPLLAALVGNDYMSLETSRVIRRIVGVLSKSSAVEDCAKFIGARSDDQIQSQLGSTMWTQVQTAMNIYQNFAQEDTKHDKEARMAAELPGSGPIISAYKRFEPCLPMNIVLSSTDYRMLLIPMADMPSFHSRSTGLTNALYAAAAVRMGLDTITVKSAHSFMDVSKVLTIVHNSYTLKGLRETMKTDRTGDWRFWLGVTDPSDVLMCASYDQNTRNAMILAAYLRILKNVCLVHSADIRRPGCTNFLLDSRPCEVTRWVPLRLVFLAFMCAAAMSISGKTYDGPNGIPRPSYMSALWFLSSNAQRVYERVADILACCAPMGEPILSQLPPVVVLFNGNLMHQIVWRLMPSPSQKYALHITWDVLREVCGGDHVKELWDLTLPNCTLEDFFDGRGPTLSLPVLPIFNVEERRI